MLSSRSTDPIVARITEQDIVNKNDTGKTGTGTDKEIILEGAAVFKHNQLVGWLDARETRGVLWVQNKIKRGTLTFSNPLGNHKPITFEILESIRKMNTMMVNNQLVVNLSIFFDGNMIQQTSNADILSSNLYNEEETVKAYENALVSQVEQEIFAALAKAQQYQVDVFGIGEHFYIEHPQEFKKLQKDWPEVMAKAQFNIAATMKIRRVGLINRSINAQNERN